MIQSMPPTAQAAPLSGSYAKGTNTAADDAGSFAALMAKDQAKGQTMENPPSQTDDTPGGTPPQPAEEQTEDIKADSVVIGETDLAKKSRDANLALETPISFRLDTPQTKSSTETVKSTGSHPLPTETPAAHVEKTEQRLHLRAMGRDLPSPVQAQGKKAVPPNDVRPSNTVITLQPATVAQSAPTSDKTMSLLERAIAQTHAPPKASGAKQTPTALSTVPTPANGMPDTVTPGIQLRPTGVAQNHTLVVQTGVPQPTPDDASASVKSPTVKVAQNDLPANYKAISLTDGLKPQDAAKVQTPTVAQSPTPKVAQNAGPIPRTPFSQFDLTEGSQRAESAVGHLERASATPTVVNTSPVPTQSADQARHIAQQLAQAMPTSTPGTTEITLNPEELGRVRMSITLSDGAMTLTIQAERPETTELMRRHIEQLAQTYRQLGFTNMNFNFEDTPQGRPDTSPQGETTDQDIITDETSQATPTGTPQIIANGRLDVRI